jgi:hypothetical protein
MLAAGPVLAPAFRETVYTFAKRHAASGGPTHRISEGAANSVTPGKQRIWLVTSEHYGVFSNSFVILNEVKNPQQRS